MTVSASAPGKVILFGEHAVVYDRPAIAVPVTQVRATAEIRARTGNLQITATDLGHTFLLDDAPPNDPLATAVRLTLEQLQASPPAATILVRSTIPIASGLGSGAAVSVAIIRALASYLGARLSNEIISDLAFRVEKIHHGTPSGIDNNVVTFCRPVYFRRGRPVQTFQIETPFQLLIADTGILSPTKVTVGDVRRGRQVRPAHYEALFDQIGQVVERARAAIESGQVDRLGALMMRNQALLEQLNVSSPRLETLSQAALAAGAEGAKLSGAGRGGNLIVLVQPEVEAAVSQALLRAGAVNVIATRVGQVIDELGE
jgi:mevalonate kinase